MGYITANKTTILSNGELDDANLDKPGKDIVVMKNTSAKILQYSYAAVNVNSVPPWSGFDANSTSNPEPSIFSPSIFW
jgi:hypothetical protein